MSADTVDIIEVAQMIKDRDSVQKDLSEAAQMVRNLFYEKYISKLHGAVMAQQKSVSENPSKEVQLMQAMKRFVPDENRRQIDRMIEALNLQAALKDMRARLTPADPAPPPVRAAAHDETALTLEQSVHDDGVYDVDYTCLENQKTAGTAPPPNLMALLFFLNML